MRAATSSWPLLNRPIVKPHDKLAPAFSKPQRADTSVSSFQEKKESCQTLKSHARNVETPSRSPNASRSITKNAISLTQNDVSLAEMRVELTLADREDQVESGNDSTSPAISAEKLIPYPSSHPAADQCSVANVLVRVEQVSRELSWINRRTVGGSQWMFAFNLLCDIPVEWQDPSATANGSVS